MIKPNQTKPNQAYPNIPKILKNVQPQVAKGGEGKIRAKARQKISLINNPFTLLSWSSSSYIIIIIIIITIIIIILHHITINIVFTDQATSSLGSTKSTSLLVNNESMQRANSFHYENKVNLTQFFLIIILIKLIIMIIMIILFTLKIIIILSDSGSVLQWRE